MSWMSLPITDTSWFGTAVGAKKFAVFSRTALQPAEPLISLPSMSMPRAGLEVDARAVQLVHRVASNHRIPGLGQDHAGAVLDVRRLIAPTERVVGHADVLVREPGPRGVREQHAGVHVPEERVLVDRGARGALIPVDAVAVGGPGEVVQLELVVADQRRVEPVAGQVQADRVVVEDVVHDGGVREARPQPDARRTAREGEAVDRHVAGVDVEADTAAGDDRLRRGERRARATVVPCLGTGQGELLR